MSRLVQPEQLIQQGLSEHLAIALTEKVNHALSSLSPETAWHTISKTILTKDHPFAVHLFLFKTIFHEWPHTLESAPAYYPANELIKTTHLYQFMESLHLNNVAQFHEWTVKNYPAFWKKILEKLHIVFEKPPGEIIDLSQGIEKPTWLPGATLNIANSCFNAPATKTAIIFHSHQGTQQIISYDELNKLSNRVANSLLRCGLRAGDKIAIDLPMTASAVAIYLGIIKMGGVVISIADSFTADEITTRLNVSHAQAIFTQDYIVRGVKKLHLYEKVISANAPNAIVLTTDEKTDITLRHEDKLWHDFLVADEDFSALICNPMDHITILFSSGTTGTPKAIPWNHTTAIKAASDAYLHQDVQSTDIISWPTNLGWMMGPWLIFSALINQATIAIFDGLAQESAFGQFVQDARVTILGVVPTLVAHWRKTSCMEKLDWRHIKTFTSTAECSNPEDMLYLMSLAGYKPVIEYCGGTEIGGGYISSTVIEKNYPSVLTTPVFGINFCLLDEEGQLTTDGEVAIVPPSMGLSTELLNANHHETYYANMPHSLRRHGDQIKQLSNGMYCMIGRTDDTMNLGGIKISSAEIERVLANIPGITETAAIAVSPAHHGPSQLFIYAATDNALDKQTVLHIMQERINQHLNPLFKIQDVFFLKELPKTASNKIIRKQLRSQRLSNN